MLNAGALATTALDGGETAVERWQNIHADHGHVDPLEPGVVRGAADAQQLVVLAELFHGLFERLQRPSPAVEAGQPVG